MLGLYQITLVGTIIAAIYLVNILFTMKNSLQDGYDLVIAGEVDALYDVYEENIATRFNQFFFSAAASCTGESSTVPIIFLFSTMTIFS
jgi:hypothetical protein